MSYFLEFESRQTSFSDSYPLRAELKVWPWPWVSTFKIFLTENIVPFILIIMPWYVGGSENQPQVSSHLLSKIDRSFGIYSRK
jgi:hypothetical protein